MLELQRKQLAKQEKTRWKQAEVLELQARELRESLEERKREAERGTVPRQLSCSLAGALQGSAPRAAGLRAASNHRDSR